MAYKLVENNIGKSSYLLADNAPKRMADEYDRALNLSHQFRINGVRLGSSTLSDANFISELKRR